jgi:hypothetical protein
MSHWTEPLAVGGAPTSVEGEKKRVIHNTVLKYTVEGTSQDSEEQMAG